MIKNIYGFEKLSLVDFDGKMSATIFFGGCNFRCPFCHNSSLVLNPTINEQIDYQTIKEYLMKRKNILEAVCVSGGEPTLYRELEEMLTDIKKMGYLIKLDTNGTNPEVIKRLKNNNLIDYVAMDIKNSFSKYFLTTGLKSVDLNPIKESIEFLMTSGIDYEFRTTLIKEFHEKKDIEEIGKALKGAKRIYLQHFIDNDNCIKSGLNEISKEEALEFKEILKKDILRVELRGYE